MSGNSEILQDGAMALREVSRVLGFNFLNRFQEERPAIRKPVQTTEATIQLVGGRGVPFAELAIRFERVSKYS